MPTIDDYLPQMRGNPAELENAARVISQYTSIRQYLSSNSRLCERQNLDTVAAQLTHAAFFAVEEKA